MCTRAERRAKRSLDPEGAATQLGPPLRPRAPRGVACRLRAIKSPAEKNYACGEPVGESEKLRRRCDKKRPFVWKMTSPCFASSWLDETARPLDDPILDERYARTNPTKT